MTRQLLISPDAIRCTISVAAALLAIVVMYQRVMLINRLGPVKVTGALTDPTVRPDIEGYLKGKVQEKLNEEKGKIEEKVKDIIVEQLGVNPEQVTPQASFIEDLGADSLDIVELVMAFEEEFSVEVPDEDAEKLQTVGDVVKYIEEKSSKQ